VEKAAPPKDGEASVTRIIIASPPKDPKRPANDINNDAVASIDNVA
jgi:hypothetical protein